MTKAQAGHLLDEIAEIGDLATAEPAFKARAGFDGRGKATVRVSEATTYVEPSSNATTSDPDAYAYFVEVEVNRASRGANAAHMLRLLALAAEFQINAWFRGDLIVLH